MEHFDPIVCLYCIQYMHATLCLTCISFSVLTIVCLYSTEPYTPTGNFEADFCELAIRAGFPTMQVVPRPRRPPTPTPTPPETAPVTGKGDKDKNSGMLCSLIYTKDVTVLHMSFISIH